MQPLTTNRHVLSVLCVYPVDEGTSRSKRLTYILFTVFVFAGNLTGFTTSVAFFLKFLSSDFESSLHALLQICAFIASTYVLVVGLHSRHEIRNNFKRLAKIYDASANTDTFQFLEQANRKSEYFSKQYLKFIVGGFILNTLTMSAFSLLFCWINNRAFDAKYVYHPFRILVPWNIQTLRGYFGEIIFDLIFADTYLFSNCSLLLLFISMCLHHQEFNNRLAYSFGKLDQVDKTRNDKKFLCEIIIFHKSAKEWSSESAEIYSRFLLIQLVCNTVYLACVAFELDMQIRNFSLSIIIMLISVVVGMSNQFLYCYFGKLATDSFAKMSDSMYEASWTSISVKLQKYFILMIGNAQIPFFYHGFGLAVLDLETFTKMLKTVFTYYMLFKTLTTK